MAVVNIAPGIVNPYGTGQTANGSIPGDAATGFLKRFIGPYVDALEPQKTPVLTAIQSRAEKETATQLKIEQQTEYVRQFKTTLAGGAYTAAQTTLNFGTTNIKLLQKGMVLKIESEYFWTNADPNVGAGTISVAFAQAGSSNANHAQNVAVNIIGTANPLNGPAPYLSPAIYGDFTWNTIQRFNGSNKFDSIGNKVSDLQFDTSDKVTRWIAKEAEAQKLLLNKALMFGERQVGDLTAGSETPALMRGIQNWLTTNVTTLTGSPPLTLYDIEEATANVWSTYEDMAMTMLCSMKTKRSLNRVPNVIRRAETGEVNLNLTMDVIELETGRFEFMIDRNMPDGEIWGLNFSDMVFYTFEGEDWNTVDVETGTPFAVQKSVSGTFSLLVPKEPLMWRITGFSQDLADYPTDPF